jgi:hypothetical protein
MEAAREQRKGGLCQRNLRDYTWKLRVKHEKWKQGRLRHIYEFFASLFL